MISKLLLLCLLAVTSALNAGVSARVPSRTAVTMSATGRRAAVAGLFAATLAQSASAKTIEEIAAESNKAAVADREYAVRRQADQAVSNLLARLRPRGDKFGDCPLFETDFPKLSWGPSVEFSRLLRDLRIW